MDQAFTRFHYFLIRHSFYPIVLSSILAMAFYAGRVILGHNWNYNNLVWNLFLAWIPYSISLATDIVNRVSPRQGWLLILPGIIWIIFFPNAPYIVTDFLHLEERPPIPLWYDIGLLATFSWTGIFLAIASLQTMQSLVQKYLGKVTGWVFAFFVLSLGGLGIYLGRFARWNSWDLFFQPHEVARDLALRTMSGLNVLRFMGFTLMFTAFLVVVYLMFTSVQKRGELEHKEAA